MSKAKIMRQDIQAYVDLNYKPHPSQLKSPPQIYPKKTDGLDIDPLEHDINKDFEENFPHHAGLISEEYQRSEKS